MDQIIPVIEFLKKNKFWIACGIVAIAMISTWFIASGKLGKETQSGQQAIKSQITSAGNILRVRPEGADDVNAHPNQTTVEGMEQEISKTVDSLVKAWQARYESQSKVRIWPTEVLENEKFVEFFSNVTPEKFPTTENGSSMKSLLKIYREQIPNQMANIAKKADTKWMFAKANTKKSPAKAEDKDKKDDSQQPPGVGGVGREDRGASGVAPEAVVSDDPPVVLWNEQNQQLWQEKLTKFKGRDDHRLDTQDPSPLQIFMLQQDLWLLEAMFQIIGDVNGQALATDLAPIKQIDHIAFGREARAVLGSVQDVSPDLGQSSQQNQSQNELPENRQRATRPSRFSKQTGGADFSDTADDSPFHGRYVNQNYEPIGAQTVRDVAKGTDLPDQNLELIVAKRVPVRLGLVMDETKINDFIAACANSPFTFEINQVRINMHTPGEGIELKGGAPKKDKNQSGRAGDNLQVGGGGGGTAGMEREGGGTAGQDTGGASVSIDNVDTRRNFNVRVEFYGIIKIYNKVDEARLRGTIKNARESTTP